MNYFKKIKYFPNTGQFIWVVDGKGIKKGSIAGCKSREGYQLIKLRKVQYRAHRLAWFLHYGIWPNGEIDHINGQRSDNRISNLRNVTRAENSQNQRRSHFDNKSCGLLGVTWNKQHNRWQSKIQTNKKKIHVGYFDDAQEAHNAYMELKSKLYINGGCY